MLNKLNFAVLSSDNGGHFFRLDANVLIEMALQWVNVIFIVVLLSWLLYKPALKFLTERRERIQGEIAKAAADMQDAEDKRKHYQGKLEAIVVEKEEILSSARKLASQKEAEIIQNANGEAASILERARVEIEREREKAKDEMRTQIIQVSALMAEQLMGKGMDETDRNKILDEAISELGDAVWKG
ncbi:MAG: F0F1 ATP synthase subunit B [Defluviitaleaceae bacterium]|nr:F0F1 ATP synthase subunit B [Defluviitaleaceae bacterium]